MPGLSPELILERAISAPGGVFTVRGLSGDEVVGLFTRQRESLSGLYDRLLVVTPVGPRLSLESGPALGALLLHEAPAIVAEVIAMAAGPVSDEAVRVARQLPFPTQLAAIEAIAELTFHSETPPKKVLEAVVKAMGGIASALGALSDPPSQDGSGISAAS